MPQGSGDSAREKREKQEAKDSKEDKASIVDRNNTASAPPLLADSNSLFAFGGDPIYASIFADISAYNHNNSGQQQHGAHQDYVQNPSHSSDVNSHFVKPKRQNSHAEVVSGSPNARTAIESADFIWRGDDNKEYPFGPQHHSGSDHDGYAHFDASQHYGGGAGSGSSGPDEVLVDAQGRQVCRYFLQGNCARGRSCNFSHAPAVGPQLHQIQQHSLHDGSRNDGVSWSSGGTSQGNGTSHNAQAWSGGGSNHGSDQDQIATQTPAYFMPQMMPGYDPSQLMAMAAHANMPPQTMMAMMAQQQQLAMMNPFLAQQAAGTPPNAMMMMPPMQPAQASAASSAPSSPREGADGDDNDNVAKAESAATEKASTAGSVPKSTGADDDASLNSKNASSSSFSSSSGPTTWASIAQKNIAPTAKASSTANDSPSASAKAQTESAKADQKDSASSAAAAANTPSENDDEAAASYDATLSTSSQPVQAAAMMPNFNPAMMVDPRMQAYYGQMGMNPQVMMNPQMMMAYMAAAQSQVPDTSKNMADDAQKMAAAQMMMNPMINPALLAQFASINGMMFPGAMDNKSNGGRGSQDFGYEQQQHLGSSHHNNSGRRGNRRGYAHDQYNQGDSADQYGQANYGFNNGGGNTGNYNRNAGNRRHDRHERHERHDRSGNAHSYGQNVQLHLRSTPPPPSNANDPIPDLHTVEDMSELEGKIYAVCKDQQGCRFLQKKLEESEEALDMIFNEVFEYSAELMTDPFGNYLCQKLLEHCSDSQRTQIVRRVSPDLVVVSRNMHGTRAVQKLIDMLTTQEQVGIIRGALGHAVVELIQDLNGNHVVQRCLNRLSPDDNQFIFDAVTTANHCVAVATHRHGCCVLQRCIDHASEPQKVQLIREITKNSLALVQDPYGNYVVQYVLELPFPDLVESLIRSFLGHIRQLSMQKFSSNVVEKCIQLATAETRRLMILEVLAEENFAAMLQDPFANYVVQTGLSSAEPSQYQELVENIRPHLNLLRNTPFGKRIQSKFMKDGLLKDLIAGNIPSGNASTGNGGGHPHQQHQQQQQHGSRGNFRGGHDGGGHRGGQQNGMYVSDRKSVGPTPAEARKLT